MYIEIPPYLYVYSCRRQHTITANHSSAVGILTCGLNVRGFENYTLLGYYAASSGSFLPTFRYNVSVPSSGVKNSSGFFWILDPLIWDR
jgi:hypothetical protein